MAKEMLINVSEGEECRIAVLEDGKLEELYMERTSSTSHVGNIYKGRVTNVEPSIQAAFIDFGLGRNGFLHISDLMPTYFGRKGEDIQETVGRKMSRRDRPPIQRCLRRGDEIVVQIIKEGIGTKGPTLSTYLSIPGRMLVMMPGMGKMGVSKKIEDEEERRRLRQILDSLKPPKDVGFIIRTAGIGKTKTEIQRDLTYLSRLWQTIEKKRKSGPGPVELYTEGDLVTRTVRDVFSTDVERIVVDSKDVAKRIKEVIKITNPRTKNKVELFEEPVPLFHKYGIEREIELMYSRHVPLPSGGSLVIDSTEAIVAIDVNSGKFRDHSDAETTAFKTDMEAADEISRQLKLRDLGGVIICDFIDLRYERHRRDLEHRLHENLKKDRAKTKVLRMSQFGIIEMTRQRMRPSFKRSVYFDCPHCKGAGLVKTPESMSLDVMRRLAIAMNDQRVQRVELGVCPDVSFYLQNRKRAHLAELEGETKKRLIIKSDLTLGLDEMRLDLYDSRDGLVVVEELGLVLTSQPHVTQLGTRGGQQRSQRGRDDRRPQRGRGDRPQQPPRRPEPEAEERFELDEEEEGPESSQQQEPAVSEPDEVEPKAEQPHGPEEGEAEGGSRRRRRRRGRRGRGRRGNGQGDKQPGGEGGLDDVGPAPAAVESGDGGYDVEVTEESEAEEESVAESPALDSETGDIQTIDVPSAGQSEGEEEPRRKRRRRGGRRRRGRGKSAANGETPADQAEPEVVEGEIVHETSAPSKPSKPAARGNAKEQPAQPPVRSRSHRVVSDETPVIRTGSADRHLVSDEPVAPQPVSRPRSYRDLDAIPDDYD